MMTVKVLTEPEQRSEVSWSFDGMKVDGEVVKFKVLAKKHIDKCKEEACVKLSNCTVNGDEEVVLDNKTLVTNEPSFKISEEHMRNYFHPELVSLAEAKHLPANTRVTIRSRILKIKKPKIISRHQTYSRVVLAEEEETIELKCWKPEKKTLFQKLHEGDEVNFTAVEINIWKKHDTVSLKFTQSSTLNVLKSVTKKGRRKTVKNKSPATPDRPTVTPPPRKPKRPASDSLGQERNPKVQGVKQKLFQQTKAGDQTNDELVMLDDLSFPLDSIGDLKKLNRLLVTNKELNNHLVKKWAEGGGGTLRKVITHIFKMTMTDHLSCSINWTGRNGKYTFMNMHMKSVLEEAIKKNPTTKMATGEELQKEVARYLKGSADRDGGRRKARRKLATNGTSDLNTPCMDEAPKKRSRVPESFVSSGSSDEETLPVPECLRLPSTPGSQSADEQSTSHNRSVKKSPTMTDEIVVISSDDSDLEM